MVRYSFCNISFLLFCAISIFDISVHSHLNSAVCHISNFSWLGIFLEFLFVSTMTVKKVILGHSKATEVFVLTSDDCYSMSHLRFQWLFARWINYFSRIRQNPAIMWKEGEKVRDCHFRNFQFNKFSFLGCINSSWIWCQVH